VPKPSQAWTLIAAFDVAAKPVPKARPRAKIVGRFARVYTPAKTKAFERLVASSIPSDAGQPKDLIRVDLRVYLPRPKARPRYMPKRLWLEPEPYCRSRGDVDNYAKAILDGIGDWLGNDVAVVDLRASKHISDQPRAEIEVYTL